MLMRLALLLPLVWWSSEFRVSTQEPLKDADLAMMDVLCLSKDGRYLGVGGGNAKPREGDWKIYDLNSGKCVHSAPLAQRAWVVHAMCFSPDSKWIAVGGSYNNLFIVNVADGSMYWNITNEGHVGYITCLQFSPDGNCLISTSSDMMMRVWDLQNKKTFAVHRFTSINTNLNQWRDVNFVEKCRNTTNIEGRYNILRHFTMSPNGKHVAVSSNQDPFIPIIDWKTGKIVKKIPFKDRRTSSMAYSQDGKWLVCSACLNEEWGKILVVDVESEKIIVTFDESIRARNLVISDDKRTILVGGANGFWVLDVGTRKTKHRYFKDYVVVTSNPDGTNTQTEITCSGGIQFMPGDRSFVLMPQWTHRSMEVHFHDTATGDAISVHEAVQRLPKDGKKSK